MEIERLTNADSRSSVFHITRALLRALLTRLDLQTRTIRARLEVQSGQTCAVGIAGACRCPRDIDAFCRLISISLFELEFLKLVFRISDVCVFWKGAACKPEAPN